MKQANKQLLIVLVLVFINILNCILFFSKIHSILETVFLQNIMDILQIKVC